MQKILLVMMFSLIAIISLPSFACHHAKAKTCHCAEKKCVCTGKANCGCDKAEKQGKSLV